MMRLERITEKKHPKYEDAMALYQISFPKHEQRESLSQQKIMEDSFYHFCLIFNEEEIFSGTVLFWETEDFIYIEHFCVCPEMRNKQIGQKVLALLSERNKTMILEIDPPIDEISKRRKGFYERCGFKENPYDHVHPPYHQGNKGHELVIMTNPEKISSEAYNRFNCFLNDRIMAEVF